MGFQKFKLWPVISLSIVPLIGCTSTAPLGKINHTLFCENDQCYKLSPENHRSSLASIKKIFNDRLSYDFPTCESKQLDANCTRAGMGLTVFALIIPARGALQSMNIKSVTNDSHPNTLKLKIGMNTTYAGIPMICTDADATLSISDADKLVLEIASYYCNWAVVGHTFSTASAAIDKVDITNRKISGYYSIGVKGTGNGNGSGYGTIKIPVIPLASDALAE